MPLSSQTNKEVTVQCDNDSCGFSESFLLGRESVKNWLLFKQIINTRVLHFESSTLHELEKKSVNLFKTFPMTLSAFCSTDCFLAYLQKNAVKVAKELPNDTKKYTIL